jgi:hypothetical protein
VALKILVPSSPLGVPNLLSSACPGETRIPDAVVNRRKATTLAEGVMVYLLDNSQIVQ